ncbi:carbamoyl phosphate synthase small subunit [Lentilactobacillus sp. Marseille-Q4993]|uniref:carbamoyl phosphate synthase small subunit n=1 Tax=Lentilactobacillus sp. Marseille-Q4993 TaxID=3039492 RepID=UPI0024BCA57D|nr:carbamoyl phosphate synthase small subunit [Lentilactobacillus sp. Marseille-Q4993]
MKKYLTLENGETFVGTAFGDLAAEIDGEIVFTTSMTGYQESITDPSYQGQIITFTYPLIGNYGISMETSQSKNAQASAVVVHEVSDKVFHYQSVITLDSFLKQERVPGIANIDTRKLTKIIRNFGTMKASLTNKPLPAKQTGNPSLSVIESQQISNSADKNSHHVVLVDFGVKDNIVSQLKYQGTNVTVVTPDATFEDIENLNPDGILLSNGPGDPTDYMHFLPIIRQLQEKYPTFGICLGHQLLALANGAKTYKLPFGHRGINHPVKNLLTGEIYITSQNHGYAVDIDSLADTPLELTAVEVNDKTCEGLRYPGKPIFSVQYHPEAAPGPHEARKLFSQFIEMIEGGVKNA